MTDLIAQFDYGDERVELRHHVNANNWVVQRSTFNSATDFTILLMISVKSKDEGEKNFQNLVQEIIQGPLTIKNRTLLDEIQVHKILKDPFAVRINMMRGSIAAPSVETMMDIHGERGQWSRDGYD
jgi:hypothetical protein